MQPESIDLIGGELAVKWTDGRESYYGLPALRRACPCAECQGESDLFGNVAGGQPKPVSEKGVQLVRITNVGGYAIQPIWGDGHASGIYTFDYLRRVDGIRE